MKRRIPVGKTSDLEPNAITDLEVEGQVIAIYNTGSGLFATAGYCTHGKARLSLGYLEEDTHEVECRMHGGRFDFITGQATAQPCTVALRTYPVIVEGDDVLVELDEC